MVGEEKGNKILGNSVFIVIAGSNDYANNYFGVGVTRLKYDVPSYANLMLGYASNFTKVLNYVLLSLKWLEKYFTN